MAKASPVKETVEQELERLKVLVRQSALTYRQSKLEAAKANDLFHGRGHLTPEQLEILAKRGQPAQIYNMVKEFTLKLAGYISGTRKEIAVRPRQQAFTAVANVMNDVISTTNRKNDLTTLHFGSVIDLLLSGLAVTEYETFKTGEKDQYGRPMYDLLLHQVPEYEVFLDPWSRKLDYSDARVFTRRKWVGSYDFEDLFGRKMLERSQPFSTVISGLGYDWDVEQNYAGIRADEYRETSMYEVLHTTLLRDDKVIEYHWNEQGILHKQDVTEKENQFRYTVRRLFPSNKPEYYGVFRDLFGTQDAVNQSIIAMQHMLNTSKVLLEKGAVENVDKFAAQYNKINGIAEVNDGALSSKKIQVEKFTVDLVNYQRKLADDIARVERSLPMNSAFQGLAPASDSGKKVELQQTSVIVGQTYILNASDGWLRQIGEGTLSLIKQYFTAEQVFRLSDGQDRDKWVTINQPVVDASGQVIYQTVSDPDTGKPMTNEDGTFVMAPMQKTESAIGVGDYELEIRTKPSGLGKQESEEALLFALQSTQGLIPPADTLRIIAMYVKNKDAKDSEKIAEILRNNAEALSRTETGTTPAILQPSAQPAEQATQPK